ncbi:hypothetical protein Bca4012_084094 [Brassica carinata]
MCKMQYKNVGGTKVCGINEMNAELGTTKDLENILEVTPAGRKFLRRIMGKESDWNVNGKDDAVVDRWTKNIPKGKKKQIFFKEMYKNDYTSRTTHVEAPSAFAFQKTPVETPLIKTPGVKDLNEIESRLRKELQEGFTEHKCFLTTGFYVLNEKVQSLGNQVTHVEAEVKSLMQNVGQTVRQPDGCTVGKTFEHTIGQTAALFVMEIAHCRGEASLSW